jgi:uncharacterized protein YabE (DUF348 family)
VTSQTFPSLAGPGVDEPQTSPLRRALAGARRPVALVTAGALVVLTAGGAVAAGAAHKTVEVDVDGRTVAVSTFAGSVEGALARAGISVGENDQVTPALDAPLSDGAEIVVRHAVPLAVTVDGGTETVWTAAPTASDALAALLASGRDASAVASRSSADGRDTLDLPIAAGGTAVVLVDGKTLSVALDGSARLGEVLEQAGVQLGDYDKVEVALGADGAPTVSVIRVTPSERVETAAVPFSTREQNDANLYVGERRVVQEGSAGTVERTFRVVTVQGAEVYASAPVEKVLAEPVERVVAVGTKERPVAAPAPARASGGGAATVTGSGVWGALAQCESGGNPAAVSANGLYYGLYQFSLGTWRSVGGTGLPSQASPAEQTQRAQALQARSGWGQWPHCSAKLGLR